MKEAVKVQPKGHKKKSAKPLKHSTDKNKTEANGNGMQNGKIKKSKNLQHAQDAEEDKTIEDKPTWKKVRGRNSKKTTTLTIKPAAGEKWWSLKIGNQESSAASGDEVKPLSTDELASIKKKAETLLEKDVSAYTTYCIEGDGKADYLWMNKILKSGTLPDQMAAYTVRIQDSPVHGLYSLQQLIAMVKPQGKQQCLMVADTVRDLFLQDLLPINQKLRTFESRSTSLRNASDKQLIVWLFEDRLKFQYFNFIEAIKRMSSDQIEKLRGKGISIIEQLLASHPEREDLLLQILVNKLGDPIKKVGSRALFHLSKLLQRHPQMKSIVVDEVERLLFRNNVSSRARYYGICFLNGLRLDKSEATLAAKLVKVYLGFFKGCVKTGEIDSKLMGGLLTGVNNTFPIAKLVGYEFTESLDVLFKIVQLSHFNIGVQALALLFQVTQINPNGADRFYRVLYRKLLDPEVGTTSHGMQFLNIVFKSMKKDTVINRVKGFAKRLLQVCVGSPPNMICGILFLLSEVGRTHHAILSVENEGADQKINDGKDSGVQKTESERQPRDSKKIRKQKSDMNHLLRTTNVQLDAETDPTVTDEGIDKSDVMDQSVIEIKEDTDLTMTIESNLKEYDPMARNPSFCGAEKTLAFELTPLAQHFHPSVSLFAQTLLDKGCIRYDGNPLKDFTIIRFLERFVYRNAKANTTRYEYQPQGLRAVPVNCAAYLSTTESEIPIEERFFYRYFKESKEKLDIPVKVEDEEELDSDAESVGDEEFDKIMGSYFETNGALASDEEDVDFMSNVKKSKKKGKKVVEDDDLESDENEVDEESNPESGTEDDDDADEFIEMDSEEEPEFDAEDGDFDDDEDDGAGLDDIDVSGSGSEDDIGFSKIKSKLKIPTSRKSKLRGFKSNDVFAPAEQFSEMLESNANEDFSGSHTLINTDNSNMKQMKWEANRDRWVKGHKRNQKGQGKAPSKKRKFK